MKLFTRIVAVLLIVIPLFTGAQITTPVIRANFGIDADLRANFFSGFVQSGNDDWFNMAATPGTGKFMIDTTGAAAILARYAIDPNFRRLPFYRTMNYPAFSVQNNRLLIDAVFIRDYHGDDSTIFASGSNKNGMSPADWQCPVAQSIPDKNEILDMMVHVRRAGPAKTDSLWMFGGLSIENTTGNRFFDFEMYQTDIYYDRPSRRFYNYGPDAGHTSWLFDAAGNVTRPGDIIFTAEYSSSSLTLIQARIWIDKASLSMDPVNFDWTGAFDGDGAGAQFGYAAIMPETAGPFYMGLQSVNNTWAGPFSLVLGDNSIVTTYTARQFMEFGVNLKKLGLDPVDLLGGDVCGMPFRKILVKTRASTSFTAELKDFVGPFDFFLAPRADAAADIPVLCDAAQVSTISVTNPSPTSDYTWTTPDGSIISPPFGPSIVVNDDGMYIVTQRLQAGCSIYAIDTVYVTRDLGCQVLKNGILNFSGVLNNKLVTLKWLADRNDQLAWFDVERSTNGYDFVKVGRVEAKPGAGKLVDYDFSDLVDEITSTHVYYRLSVRAANGATAYSTVIRLLMSDRGPLAFTITPNPVKESMQLNLNSASNQPAHYRIIDAEGKIMYSQKISLQKGNNVVSYSEFDRWSPGVYQVQVIMAEQVFNQKFVLLNR
jgi:hypothetical protein